MFSCDIDLEIVQSQLQSNFTHLYTQCNCKWLYRFGAAFCKILILSFFSSLICQTVVINYWAKMVWAELVSNLLATNAKRVVKQNSHFLKQI
jgi:hypothetical protein